MEMKSGRSSSFASRGPRRPRGTSRRDRVRAGAGKGSSGRRAGSKLPTGSGSRVFTRGIYGERLSCSVLDGRCHSARARRPSRPWKLDPAHLSDRGAGQAVDDNQLARSGEGRQFLAYELAQLAEQHGGLECQPGRGGYDVGDQPLAPVRVGTPRHGRLEHAGVAPKHLFDLDRPYVLSPGDDGVVESPEDPKAPLLVDLAGIAGRSQPSRVFGSVPSL